jgi:hypothetical protein
MAAKARIDDEISTVASGSLAALDIGFVSSLSIV